MGKCIYFSALSHNLVDRLSFVGKHINKIQITSAHQTRYQILCVRGGKRCVRTDTFPAPGKQAAKEGSRLGKQAEPKLPAWTAKFLKSTTKNPMRFPGSEMGLGLGFGSGQTYDFFRTMGVLIWLSTLRLLLVGWSHFFRKGIQMLQSPDRDLSEDGFLSFLFFFFFPSFQGYARSIWRFPGQRSNQSRSSWPTPEPQQPEPRLQPTPQLMATPDP